jgi:hypothetical protein
MSKFIKLTNLIINTNYIQSIVIKPNKYYINVAINKFDGSQWSVTGFGMGTISSYNNEIEVCETKHSSDYKILNDWIVNETKKYVKKKLQ